MDQSHKAAIRVRQVSKNFLVPHQKIDSVRGLFVNLFTPNTYEKFSALDDVSFTIKKGEFVGILGHNGSGKSTLLKCLANVYNPDEGAIEIDGQVSPFLELGIGFNPNLSGRDNIYLNATILGMSKQEIDQKFNDIVEFSEIGRFIDQKVKNYSSGMRSRLAFSVSTHANRDILLMDEVLAVGDVRFKDKCMELFKTYKKKGKTVVLVTHSTNIVREHCDSALLLHKGKIVNSGDVDDVVDQYIDLNMSKEQREREAQKEKKKIQQQEKLQERKRRMHEKELERKAAQKKKMKVNTVKRYIIPSESYNLEVSDVSFSTKDESQECKISVTYKFTQELHKKNPSIGISVYGNKRVYITGTDTKGRSLPKAGEITLTLENFNITREEDIAIDAGIFYSNNGKVFRSSVQSRKVRSRLKLGQTRGSYHFNNQLAITER